MMAGPSYPNFQRPVRVVYHIVLSTPINPRTLIPLGAHAQLNYHLYAPPLPHTSNHHPHQMALNSFFLPASIRETLQKSSY